VLAHAVHPNLRAERGEPIGEGAASPRPAPVTSAT
jgi:hypothetical protein